MIAPERLEAIFAALPASPGCYLFKGEGDAVLYVGKAKSLRSRVKNYYQEGSSDTRPMLPLLRKNAIDIEVVLTPSELEALLLENTLIKKHKPRYNVRLRDDKTYPSLRLHKGENWPRLRLVRRPVKDGATYYGPYANGSAARKTLHVVTKHFQLRTCSDSDFASRTRPCLQYQIKRCAAPCVYEVDAEWYAGQAHNVALFLQGKHEDLSARVHEQMRAAAAQQQFELAALYRDQLRALQSVGESQHVSLYDGKNRDVVGIWREADRAQIACVYVRDGRVSGVRHFAFKGQGQESAELLAAFVVQHYEPLSGAEEIPIPEEVLLPEELAEELLLGEWLSGLAGRRVAVLHPARGMRMDLLNFARDNAQNAAEAAKKNREDVESRALELKGVLRMDRLPLRIECTDISHMGGQDTVGVVVAMSEGKLDKARYRSFHVRGQASGERGAASRGHIAGDDYGAIKEVLSRRFARGKEESDDGSWALPDLFVVDGGRGQLRMALEAAAEVGIEGVLIVGLAKEKENVLGETLTDRVYLPGQKNPIAVRTSASLGWLVQLRDEAHRYSNKMREKLGTKTRLASLLDGVPGIGPVAKRALLTHVGGPAQIAKASDAALLAVSGMNARKLAALRAAFGAALEVEAPEPEGDDEEIDDPV